MNNDLEDLESNEASDDEVIARDRLHADILKTLSTPHGQRVIQHFLDKCGLFRLSYTGNAQTHFNEGVRSVGLSILGDIEQAAKDSDQLYSLLRSALIRG